jgi:hypothetical protein
MKGTKEQKEVKEEINKIHSKLTTLIKNTDKRK